MNWIIITDRNNNPVGIRGMLSEHVRCDVLFLGNVVSFCDTYDWEPEYWSWGTTLSIFDAMNQVEAYKKESYR